MCSAHNLLSADKGGEPSTSAKTFSCVFVSDQFLKRVSTKVNQFFCFFSLFAESYEVKVVNKQMSAPALSPFTKLGVNFELALKL